MKNNKIELIKKLQALAECGIEGEKRNAKQLMEQLMQKYDIDKEDLDDEAKEEFVFKYHNKFEKKLLIQIFYKIIGKDYLKSMAVYSYGPGSRTTFIIECTKAEGIQIGIEFEFYSALWKEEAEFFFSCFIMKHELFQSDEDKQLKENDELKLTHEELMRYVAGMNAMQNKSIVPQLEEYS